MSREKIDWAGCFEGAQVIGAEQSADMMGAFVERAVAELAPLYIPDEVVASVEAAGCRIEGSRYFTKLFSAEPNVTPDDRVRSTFTGSVAHGREVLVGEAYGLLTANGDVEVVNADLVERLGKAMINERWVGSYKRLDRLEAAAKAIGKPLFRRAIGGLATGLAMHAR